MRTSRVQSHRPAFTLLELVLVLLVITIAVGVAAPSLRGWNRGSRMRDTADQLIALARLARTQAASTAQVHRLTLGSGRCVVMAQDGEQFVELGEAAGGAFSVPEGVSVQLTDLQGGPREFVEFYPNGRMQTARFKVSMDDGYVIIVECATPTEGFRVASSGGSR
jgi:prepilin-type N-terminal cleavage/methylation domain-containing protein